MVDHYSKSNPKSSKDNLKEEESEETNDISIDSNLTHITNFEATKF